jgi:hypothetical protein
MVHLNKAYQPGPRRLGYTPAVSCLRCGYRIKAIAQLKTAATTLLQRHLGAEEAQKLAEIKARQSHRRYIECRAEAVPLLEGPAPID